VYDGGILYHHSLITESAGQVISANILIDVPSHRVWGISAVLYFLTICPVSSISVYRVLPNSWNISELTYPTPLKYCKPRLRSFPIVLSFKIRKTMFKCLIFAILLLRQLNWVSAGAFRGTRLSSRNYVPQDPSQRLRNRSVFPRHGAKITPKVVIISLVHIQAIEHQ
jgi:hypothetical protein